MKANKLIIGCLCAIGSEILYGSSFLFTKTATQIAGAFALLGWRFFLALIIFSVLILLGVFKINIKGKSLKPLLILALFFPLIYFICETIGIKNSTASESGVILATIPIASLIASTLILKKKPLKVQVAGILITTFGVVVTVLGVGASSNLSVSSYVFLLLAVVSYALYSVFVEKAYDYTESEITFIMLLIGAAFFVSVALVQAATTNTLHELITLPFRSSMFTIAILYQGIGCSILAFLFSNVAISTLGVNKTSSFIGIATVVSILSGALFLNEAFTSVQIIGAALIILGVYVANSRSLFSKDV